MDQVMDWQEGLVVIELVLWVVVEQLLITTSKL